VPKNVGEIIDTFQRSELVIIDLCRHGDYAEATAVVGSQRRRRGFRLSA
jgi:hypothetical protein